MNVDPVVDLVSLRELVIVLETRIWVVAVVKLDRLAATVRVAQPQRSMSVKSVVEVIPTRTIAEYVLEVIPTRTIAEYVLEIIPMI